MVQPLRVNTNRMELLRLRRRLKVAQRGHKLLKDKLDELMKEFLARITAARRLRSRVEAELTHAYALFAVARSDAGSGNLALALLAGGPLDVVSATQKRLMSVSAPVLGVGEFRKPGDYSLATTPAALDDALYALAEVVPRMIELAEREKTIELLAAEIESTRRRVNALEHVVIPQLVATVRFIQMKLDEVERANLTRLIKVKEIAAGTGRYVLDRESERSPSA